MTRLLKIAKILVYTLLTVIVLFFVAPIMDIIKNQVTVYPICISEEGYPVPLNPSVYKVFPESQSIIYWMPDIDETPRKLTNCSVRDRLHWRGEYPDGSGIKTMDDGKFQIQLPENGQETNIEYVSSLKWWKLTFSGMVKYYGKEEENQ